jgi:hypothetical protein
VFPRGISWKKVPERSGKAGDLGRSGDHSWTGVATFGRS